MKPARESAKITYKAAAWYLKSDEQGYADGQSGLCLYGWGVEKDFAKALFWLRKVADNGEAIAQLNLGRMYFNNEGVQQDYTGANTWFHKAAQQGFTQSLAALTIKIRCR